MYKQMVEVDKEDAEKIKTVLKIAFGARPIEAYEDFRVSTRSYGESVDVFLSDLRRLAGLAGILNDNLLKLAFVVGMPKGVSAQLGLYRTLIRYKLIRY